MGYSSVYRVYDGTGKSLGVFTGWTQEEALKKAQEDYPHFQNPEGFKAKYIRENR